MFHHLFVDNNFIVLNYIYYCRLEFFFANFVKWLVFEVWKVVFEIGVTELSSWYKDNGVQLVGLTSVELGSYCK